jgi:hypothetical protein
MSRGPACSSVATRSTMIAPSPSTRAPTIRARSARVLVGDVDALAGVNDGVLQDQVELLGGGDLLDHLVRALLDAGELLVAAQIEILTEFTLHPLQVARLVRKIALLVAPVGIGHRRAVLVEQRLHVAHLFGELLDLGIASREFLFDLRLRALCGRRLAEQSLGVDEADLVLGGRGRAGDEDERDGEACLQQAC